MDIELHCNILKCRRSLSDKAVVTTCSHIFCVDCAQERFRNGQLCPACETSLTEPDDVVISSLQPTNDYKTSVLSGLSPSTILEICTRGMSFWVYQIQQESSFQQALYKNINERYAGLQKQLENVIREANSELSLLSTKVSGLEREIETERRRSKELAEASKDKDKEYQKLKNNYDKIKRKALLAPAGVASASNNPPQLVHYNENPNSSLRARESGVGPSNVMVNVTDVVSGMEAQGIHRTPVRPGIMFGNGHHGSQGARQSTTTGYTSVGPSRQETSSRHKNAYGTSDSEVEEVLGIGGTGTSHLRQGVGDTQGLGGQPYRFDFNGFTNGTSTRNTQAGVGSHSTFGRPSSARRTSGTFRPAAFVHR